MAVTDYIPSIRALIIIVVILLAIFFGFFWTSRGHKNHPASPPPAVNPASPATSFLHGDIYPPGANAPAELRNALAEAARENKRIILDFGGNWCPDCRVLQIYFHTPPNLELLKANYILVPINIGEYDENTDLAARYGIPLKKGVPALAVLDSQGHILYSQNHGEFEDMHAMVPSSVTAFLNQWKP